MELWAFRMYLTTEENIQMVWLWTVQLQWPKGITTNVSDVRKIVDVKFKVVNPFSGKR